VATAQSDVSLAPLTTLRLGGSARSLVTASTTDELVEAVHAADAASEPLLVLAGGSNVVIADEGFDGTVVRIATSGVRIDDAGEGRARVRVAAGEDWDALVALLVGDGFAGIECLAGIPGSVGATPIQNVGAYGQEVSATLESVRVLDRSSGEIGELAAADCGLRYRSSRFKRSDRHVVLEVAFVLERSPRSQPIAYAELARSLGVTTGDRVPLAAAREAVLALRRGKGMVLDPADHDTWSAGSFFTNPVLSPDAFEAFEERVRERLGNDGSPPRFGADGDVKTSAAWLIERAGFSRGDRRGEIAISGKHALALTNRGGGTARGLVAFATEIAQRVESQFGVLLEPEPVLVGLEWAV
jgi:UDP-N-acetylmuramate dehydrogenase